MSVPELWVSDTRQGVGFGVVRWDLGSKGLPGGTFMAEANVRRVPFDEAVQRGVVEFDKWRNADDPAYYAQPVQELVGRIVRAALGEDT